MPGAVNGFGGPWSVDERAEPNGGIEIRVGGQHRIEIVRVEIQFALLHRLDSLDHRFIAPEWMREPVENTHMKRTSAPVTISSVNAHTSASRRSGEPS